jgi:hypothetical protein
MAYSITTQYWGSAIFGFDMDWLVVSENNNTEFTEATILS